MVVKGLNIFLITTLRPNFKALKAGTFNFIQFHRSKENVHIANTFPGKRKKHRTFNPTSTALHLIHLSFPSGVEYTKQI